ncbi:MAG TPA: protein kinase [Chitinispirillaceae bacterium]|nr:protein kinase [Chitinispirillaceae bacterium]
MKLPPGFDTPVIIGKGAYGTVYRVRQKQLDRQVVIKMIPFSKRKFRNRHFQEAVTQAQLHLPCFPQVYDVFIWKENVCIVMQWVRSLNLHKCTSIYQNNGLRLAVAEGVIKAVSAIHDSGYAHRDIKPANILISATEGVFLIDFGFSTKNIKNSIENNSIRGTKGYLAPEILERRDNTEIDYFRADCYALGIVLNNILGYDNQYSVLKMLTDPDPLKRPANASEAYLLWKEQVNSSELSGFSAQIDPWIRQNQSNTLFDSACQLMKLHRYNEAYRLCLETLQEIPDNPEALKMISSFGYITAQKRVRNRILASGIISAATVIIMVSYLIIKQQQKLHNSEFASLSYSDQKILHHSSQAHEKKVVSIQYKYHYSETPSFTSDIYYRVKNVNCLIYIDGKLIGESDPEKPLIHCNLPASEGYRLLITGIDGEFIKSEHLKALPFSKIYIDVVKKRE